MHATLCLGSENEDWWSNDDKESLQHLSPPFACKLKLSKFNEIGLNGWYFWEDSTLERFQLKPKYKIEKHHLTQKHKSGSNYVILIS